jgi:negative regulator of flagellin synthesis FlgM
MKIVGSTLVHSSQAISGSFRSAGTATAAPANSLAETDQLDISPAADLASRSLDGAARNERLAQIRAEIEAGTYETDEKLNAALDRLLDQLS